MMDLDARLKFLGVTVVPAGPIEDALSKIPPGAAILLGDGAMGVLNPDAVSDLAARQGWEILAAAFLSPPGVRARWAAHREFTLVLSEAALPAAVFHARRLPVRPGTLPREWATEWLRKCACGKCASLLRTAQQLGKFTRKNWARRLGMPVRALWQHLGDCLGVTPREILARLKRRVFSMGAAMGRTLAALANFLGYSGPRSLRRAPWIPAAADRAPPGDVDNPNTLSPFTALTPRRTGDRMPSTVGAATRAPPRPEVGSGDAVPGRREWSGQE